jgi:serine/threonine protein kinase
VQGHTEYEKVVINMCYMSLICKDIKPDNIPLDKDGHCKLGDFGVSAFGIVKEKKARGQCGSKLYMVAEVIITICFKSYSFAFFYRIIITVMQNKYSVH